VYGNKVERMYSLRFTVFNQDSENPIDSLAEIISGGAASARDIEDLIRPASKQTPGQHSVVSVNKRKRETTQRKDNDAELHQSWKEVLGPPPAIGDSQVVVVLVVVICIAP